MTRDTDIIELKTHVKAMRVQLDNIELLLQGDSQSPGMRLELDRLKSSVTNWRAIGVVLFTTIVGVVATIASQVFTNG